MAQTTWKQVVLDTADAIREANGTSDKIPVGQIADKVRAGAGTPYEGDNPLTIGAEGYNFPAKTLLKDGLQIINGVNGEDLTEPIAVQETAVETLLREVKRRVADHKGEGEYVWKKLTAEGGEFVDYVVSSDAEAFPDGGELDGYWYELVKEGVSLMAMFGFSKMAIDKITVSTNKYISNLDLPHSLNDIPIMVIIMTDGLREGGSNLYYAIATYYPDMASYKYTTAYARYEAGFTQGNHVECNNGGSATTWNASKIRFSDSQIYAQLPAGVEYTVITMA